MKQYEKWLSKAKRDLKSAQKLSSGDDPILDTAIYHTQQCAEKAIKGYLSYKQQPIQKTHDIIALIEMCIGFDDDFAILKEKGKKLNPYISLFRYPDIEMEPNMGAVAEAIDNAQSVLVFVEQKIYGKLL